MVGFVLVQVLVVVAVVVVDLPALDRVECSVSALASALRVRVGLICPGQATTAT